ncbi:fatty acyl-AMP ligase [Actinomadura barringtoniae]|uniref:Fatty acyl-AMP ligase n=1 Tax=Actinomadura barringtoniae TaxID=1427535 RepID=A0A939P7X1_9ACTN|nr:fatty acyl-AMP ligase [Actinomadura barringtoniae]MBO2447240.1 fatty acyl-AMP ligase [Actinomadura barringtoniae]
MDLVDRTLDRTPLIERLGRWAEKYPDDRAYTFVDYTADVDGVHIDITWGELDRKARAIAATIRRSIEPGEIVALLAPTSLEYIAALLGTWYARVVGVPLFSPDLPGYADRLISVAGDAKPVGVLTTNEALAPVRAFFDQHPELRPREIIVTEDVDLSLPWEPEPIDPDDIAYLQYTSGSTRAPAGVIITHGNVAVNAEQCWGTFDGVPRRSTGVNWLPLFHDMGLVTAVGLPIAYGSPAHIMDPVAFIMRPARWLELLSAQDEAFTCAPNFAYEYLATSVTDEEKEKLDLSGVQVFMNGAEPIRPHTMEGFLETFRGCGLRPEVQVPAYGLAEATVYVSSSSRYQLPVTTSFDRDRLNEGVAVPVPADHERSAVHVSCGQPYGQHVLIVDQKTSVRQPDGHVGEIWIHGPNVTGGYWGRPQATAETFGAMLAEPVEGVPDGPWLRTGDLGIWYEGELYCTGRIKDLVIVDGRNHYPQDLELTTYQAHEAIRNEYVAAFSVDTEQGEALVLVAERNRRVPIKLLDQNEVELAVRAAVMSKHDLRVHDFVLIEPGGLPRTTSAKIARTASRKAYQEGALPVTRKPEA